MRDVGEPSTQVADYYLRFFMVERMGIEPIRPGLQNQAHPQMAPLELSGTR